MKKILLVEDNETIVMGLKYSLEQEMFQVIPAKNVSESKEKLKQEKIDIVLLDVSLPDGNGFNICKEIKEKCEKIDDLNDEIDDLVKQCLDLNDKKQCDNCHEEIEKNVKYCPNCGTKQEEKEVLEPEVIEKVEEPEEENAFGEEQKIEEIEEDAEASTEEEKTNLEKTVEVESNPQIESEDSKKEEE